MNQKTIETFPENTVLDSTFLMCTHLILPTLTFRLKTDEELFELFFYKVLEYNQSSYESSQPSQLIIQTDSPSLKELIALEPAYRKYDDDDIETPEIDFTRCEHYIWNIGHYQFNIFAAGYKKENGFFEAYREQAKVKQIIA